MNNARDWRTTIPAVIGAIFMVVSTVLPDKISPEDGIAVSSAISQILLGVGGLIAVITGIFSRGGSD